MTTPDNTVIDNRDPRVLYQGNWNFGGSTIDINGTTSSTTDVGASFTLSFTGTQIGVYGTINANSSGATTGYSIDGGIVTLIDKISITGTNSGIGFWTSPGILLPGEHILIVTMVKITPNPKPDQGTVYFDYFLVTPITSSDTPPTPIFTPAPTTVKGPTTVTVHATKTVGAPSQSASAMSDIGSSSSHAGAIAGGVVGGVVFLLLLLLAVLMAQRRAWKKQSLDQMDSTVTKSRTTSHIEEDGGD